MALLDTLEVIITGNTTGLKGAAGEANAEASGIGSSFGGIGSMAAVGLGAAAVAITAFSLKSAQDVGGAYKSIEKQTGETGQALEGLKGSFNNVYGNFPISSQDAATTVSLVYDRLKTLQNGVPPTAATVTDLSGKLEMFSKVTGQSVTDATNTWMKAFGAFGVSSNDMGTDLEHVAEISQSSGISVNQLSSEVQRAAPTWGGLHIGIDEATASMADMDAHGIKSQSVVMGLNSILKEAGKSGEAPKKAFSDLQDELDKYNKTGQVTGELTKIGTRSLQQMALAEKDGAFNFDDLTSRMITNDGQLQKNYNDTLSFSDKLEIFKNKLELAFAPLGKAIINVLSSLLDAMTPLIPVITAIVNAFAALPAPLQLVVMAGMVAVGGIAALNMVMGKFGSIGGDMIKTATKMVESVRGIGTAAAEATPEVEGLTVAEEEQSKVPMQTRLPMGGGAGGAAGEAEGAAGEAESLAPEAGADIMGAEELAPELGAAAESGGILEGIFASISGVVEGIVGAITGIVSGIGEAVGSVGLFGGGVAGAEGGIMGILGSIPVIGWAILAVVGAFAILTATSNTFRSMLGGIVNTFMSIFGWVKDIAGALLSGNFGKVGDLLKSGFQGAIDSITHFDWSAWAGGLVTSVHESINTIIGFFAGIGQKIIGGVTEAFNFIKGIASGIGAWFSSVNWGALANGFRQAVLGEINSIRTSLGNVGTELINGIKSGISTIGNLLQGAFKTLTSIDWGGIANGLLNALKGALGQVGSFITSNWQPILATLFGGVGLLVYEALTRVDWGGVLNGLKSAIGNIGNMIGSAFDSIKNIDWGGMFAGMLDAIDNVLTQILNWDPSPLIDSLVNGLSNAVGSFVNMLTSIDWGGMLGNLISAITGFFGSIDWGGLVQGFINAIMGLFGGGGGGGGGQAGTTVTQGMSTSLSKGAEKAGPDILGKLGDVFIKLLEVVPTIFGKIAIALFNALVKIDWGALGAGILGAIGKALTAIGAYLSKIDWGAMFTAIYGYFLKFWVLVFNYLKGIDWMQILTLVYNYFLKFWILVWNYLKGIDWGQLMDTIYMALQTAVGQIVSWLKGLDWGGMANTVWNALQNALMGIVTWLTGLPWASWAATLWNDLKTAIMGIVTWLESLDWGGYANTVWNALKGAIGAIIGWLQSLDWGGYAQTVWNALKGAIGAIIGWLTGLNWGGVASTFYNAITGAVGAIIGWLQGLNWGGVASTFFNAVTGAFNGLIGFLTGINWGGVASTFYNAVTGAFGSLLGFFEGINWGSVGSNMYNDITGAFGSFASWIAGLFTQAQVSFTIPILNKTVTFNLEEGAYIKHRPGGVMVNVGEGAEDEIVAPLSKLGSLGSLKQLAGGALISSRGSISALGGGSGEIHYHKTYNVNVSGDISGALTEEKLVRILQDMEVANQVMW